MIWISLLVTALAVALIQLGAATVKVSMLTIVLKIVAALLVFFVLAAAAYAGWRRVKPLRIPSVEFDVSILTFPTTRPWRILGVFFVHHNPRVSITSPFLPRVFHAGPLAVPRPSVEVPRARILLRAARSSASGAGDLLAGRCKGISWLWRRAIARMQ